MSEIDIIELYKRGFSVQFIVDKYYNTKIFENNRKTRIFNTKYIVYEEKVNQKDCLKFVEQTIYRFLQNGEQAFVTIY